QTRQASVSHQLREWLGHNKLLAAIGWCRWLVRATCRAGLKACCPMVGLTSVSAIRRATGRRETLPVGSGTCDHIATTDRELLEVGETTAALPDRIIIDRKKSLL